MKISQENAVRAIAGLLVFVTAAVAATKEVNAERYSVFVTRKGSNTYKIDGQRAIILTRFCYEYVYYEDAILDYAGNSGTIFFLDSDSDCDVVAVYVSTTVDDGAYKVTVEGDGDFYTVNFGELLIETLVCVEIAVMDDAILRVRGGALGEIVFSWGSQCDVSGIYGKMR